MCCLVPTLIILRAAISALASDVDIVMPDAPACVLSNASFPRPALSVFAPSDYSTLEPPFPEPFMPEGNITPDPPTPESGPFTPGYFDTPHTSQHQVIVTDENEQSGSSSSSDSTITNEDVRTCKDLQTRSRLMKRNEQI
jgi:hypothetical protein